jgi:transcriptional regulator of NAD metabolism
MLDVEARKGSETIQENRQLINDDVSAISDRTAHIITKEPVYAEIMHFRQSSSGLMNYTISWAIL